MKRILTLLFLCIPLLGTAKKPDGPATLSVISYNIRNGEAKDGTNSWEFRYPASAMMIDDQKPDIWGVQEAYEYQVKYLSEYCAGYKCVGVGREDGKKEGEYMAIFYNSKKIKLGKWGTFWLSETPDEPSMGWDAACKRTATWALMTHKDSGKRFYYVNTHLDHVGKEARQKGLELIVSRIASINSEGLPVVITGDFNMSQDDPCMEGLNKVMKSCRSTAVKTDMSGTFNDWGKAKEPSAIDHVYYSGFSSCMEFEVVKKPYYDRKYISDHFPVKALLIF